jgi:hypothetical protein
VNEAQERFFDRVSPVPESGCWLWEGASTVAGYGIVVRAGKHRPAHRLSYELFIEAPPPHLDVLHTCDIKCCVNPQHLYIGTHAQNMKDSSIRGTHVRKLSDDEIRQIRSLDLLHREIAEMFGICSSYVCMIKSRKSRRHVN